MPNIWNGTTFGDLDWPLNASRGLSAIAEFLVFTLQYWINLQLCWKFSSSECCIDQTFGRKHSLVAHRHQNNLNSKHLTLSDRSGHRVKKRPGRVGSRVKGSDPVPSLSWKYVAELYIRCTCIAEISTHLWPNSIRSILSKTCRKHVFDIVCNMFSTSFRQVSNKSETCFR